MRYNWPIPMKIPRGFKLILNEEKNILFNSIFDFFQLKLIFSKFKNHAISKRNADR